MYFFYWYVHSRKKISQETIESRSEKAFSLALASVPSRFLSSVHQIRLVRLRSLHSNSNVLFLYPTYIAISLLLSFFLKFDRDVPTNLILSTSERIQARAYRWESDGRQSRSTTANNHYRDKCKRLIEPSEQKRLLERISYVHNVTRVSVCTYYAPWFLNSVNCFYQISGIVVHQWRLHTDLK